MSCAIKLLPYCVIEGPNYQTDAVGVRGAPVQSMTADSLSCIYSPIIPPQEFSQEDALRFYSVLQSRFEQQAVIPFRFPTILQNESELQAHLREKYAAYSSDLQRLQGMVQMELRIAAKQATSTARSGTEYLRSKQQNARSLQAAMQQARGVLGELIADWKERPTDQGLRCYALVKRAEVAGFRQKMEAAEFEGSTTILLSGPWPATEFLND